MLLKLLLISLAFYLLVCLLLFFGQRKLIYLPSRAPRPLPLGFVQWSSPSGEHWGYKKVDSSPVALFFFHGNGGNASGWSHAVADFPGNVFVLEYPGYGPRPGSPGEASLKQAALEGFESEFDRFSTIVLAGQSLGAAITQAVFTRHPEKIDHLVLVTPFASLVQMARSQFPWIPTGLLLRDRMPLLEEWKKFPGPTCIVLAGQDEVIPASHGAMYKAAKRECCTVIEFPDAGHNSIHLGQPFWNQLLQPEPPEN